MKWPYAFATPYGVSGASGVSSVCGTSTRLAEDLARRGLVEADRRVDRRIASSSAVTPTAANSAVSTGCSHDIGTNETEARL